MTLLKNDGGLLPLKKTAKVAFLGPQANFTQQMLSNYEGSSIYSGQTTPHFTFGISSVEMRKECGSWTYRDTLR